LTASRTSAAWSYTGLSLAPGGSVARSDRAMLATLSAIATVLPPGCLVMLRSAAGLPSPAMIRTWSSVPDETVAMSRTRTPSADDHVRDVLDRVRLAGRDDQVLLVVLRHAPTAATVVACRIAVATSSNVIPAPRGARVGDDLDLAHVASLHVHAPTPAHAR
jgi:hypothetical protein